MIDNGSSPESMKLTMWSHALVAHILCKFKLSYNTCRCTSWFVSRFYGFILLCLYFGTLGIDRAM